MKVRFLAEADAEFRETARYYEDKAPGLGIAFIAEVHRVAAIVASQSSIGVRWMMNFANLSCAVFRTT
jgi:hypothetical protein